MFDINLLSLIIGIVLGVISDQTLTRLWKWISAKIKEKFVI